MLAVVLMMGFVAAASVSLFVVGSATLTETKDSAQEQQIENTFREFNKDVSSVAFGRQKYRTMQFDVQDQTAAFRQEDTGTVKVFVDGSEKVNQSVGSLVYESDGTVIAYQAGGVWKGTGKESRMISRPPVEYQNGSLTFPIPALGGDESVHAGQLDLKKTKTESPINDDGFIEGKLVTLEITSEYYMGWAQYFREQTNDVAVEVDHSPAGPKGTVTVKLGRPLANGDFSNGVLATGGDDGDIYVDDDNTDNNLAATGEIIGTEGDEHVESSLYELDPAIERKVANAESVTNNDSDDSIEEIDIDSGNPIDEAGTYYDPNGGALSNDLTIDVSEGDVTLIVDGDLYLDQTDLKVTGASSGNVVRIYSTGNFGMRNSEAGAGTSAGAEHFQIYGTSEMLVAITGGGSTKFVGTIYAPRETPELDPSGEDGEPNPAVVGGGGSHCDGWDMCVATGSSQFEGAVVGGPTYMGQSTSVEYDESLGSIEPTLQLEDGVLPPPITFLKVSVHTVEVNNSNANVAYAGDLDAPASIAGWSSTSTSSFGNAATASGLVAAPAHRVSGTEG